MEKLEKYIHKVHRYGEVHFISFYASVLSRLAYSNNNQFMDLYLKIFGPVIKVDYMKAIDDAVKNNIDIFDDNLVFKNVKNKIDTKFEKNNPSDSKITIHFLEQKLPQHINVIIGERPKSDLLKYGIKPNTFDYPKNLSVKYISIAWSNYGEIYVVVDKRMPHCLFVNFRGTYSAKTTSSYLSHKTIIPKISENKIGFLIGIYKLLTESIHTLTNTMIHLAKNLIIDKEKIQVFSSGHSLGGGMTTIFSYIWASSVFDSDTDLKKLFKREIICLSLGSPRVLNKKISENFCKMVKQNKIKYLRMTTRGDPCVEIPLKNTGLRHPCETDKAESKHHELGAAHIKVENIFTKLFNVNYDKNLDEIDHKVRPYITNPLSHICYFDILYGRVVDISEFFKGFVSLKTREIERNNDSVTCRLIQNTNTGEKTCIFFDIQKTWTILDEKHNIYEDTGVTLEYFQTLVEKMKPIPRKTIPMSPKKWELPYYDKIDEKHKNTAIICPNLTQSRGKQTRKLSRKSRRCKSKRRNVI